MSYIHLRLKTFCRFGKFNMDIILSRSNFIPLPIHPRRSVYFSHSSDFFLLKFSPSDSNLLKMLLVVLFLLKITFSSFSRIFIIINWKISGIDQILKNCLLKNSDQRALQKSSSPEKFGFRLRKKTE